MPEHYSENVYSVTFFGTPCIMTTVFEWVVLRLTLYSGSKNIN